MAPPSAARYISTSTTTFFPERTGWLPARRRGSLVREPQPTTARIDNRGEMFGGESRQAATGDLAQR